MPTFVKASLILPAAVAVVSALIYATGFHKNFMAGQMVFLATAIAINVGVIIWALGKTAPAHRYGKQVLQATGIGLLGGVLMIAISWLLLAVIFPDVLPETREAAIAYMQANGTPQDEFDRQMEMIDNATPLSQALPGGIGTFFTSLMAGVVAAIWKRRK